ncbi:RNA-directed DNA polymerase, eukaryota, reverse transcriptase zinc-binding domain protein [Tanacetum coccineum]
MSPNKRSLKRRIKPPKWYEGSVSVTNKRNECEDIVRNDEASMEDPGTQAKEGDVNGDVTGLDQNGMETGEVTERDKVRTTMNEEKMNKMQEESNNEVNKNLNLNKNDDITSVLNEKHDNTYNDRSMGSNTDNQDFEGKSYANVLRKDETSINKNLIFIAPKITEDGDVKVLFDEAIVNKGCAKWKFIICGHFIGQNMSYYELKYHTRRMWGKYGLKEVIVNSSGVNLFKFRDEIRMKQVLDQGPWLIRNRPMFVQKWDPEIGMEKPEPKTIPIWVKLVNIPIKG